MKRIVLVNPPHSAHERLELSPPLGLLRLAQVSVDEGWEPILADYNLRWHQGLGIEGCFTSAAAKELIALDSDVYAFTSMAVDTHVALELARRIKEANPSSVILVGGVHFSSIGDHVCKHYPWVDAVAKGQGEMTLRWILRQLRESTTWRPHGVLSAHDAFDDGLAILTPLSPSTFDFADVDEYLRLNPIRKFDVESARGCRFNCSFCYSPEFYSSRSVGDSRTVLQLLDGLAARGVEHVFFVQDNFVNDPIQARRFCDELAEARLPIEWSCYATIPLLNEALVESMAKA